MLRKVLKIQHFVSIKKTHTLKNQESEKSFDDKIIVLCHGKFVLSRFFFKLSRCSYLLFDFDILIQPPYIIHIVPSYEDIELLRDGISIKDHALCYSSYTR